MDVQACCVCRADKLITVIDTQALVNVREDGLLVGLAERYFGV